MKFTLIFALIATAQAVQLRHKQPSAEEIKEIAEAMIKEADTDNNGTVSYDEAVAVHGDIPKDEFEAVAGKDGEVDAAELAAALTGGM